MKFKREIALQFSQLLKQYPIVTLLGPRQSGKTTLTTTLCKNYDYINLEDPETRFIAENDPNSLIKNHKEYIIFDEIQWVPQLLSYLQVIVDNKQKTGLFVITGSHQLALHEAITQSLAGRTAILELFPLSLLELKQAQFDSTTDNLMLMGGYPRIYN